MFQLSDVWRIDLIFQNLSVPQTCSELQIVVQQRSDGGDVEKNATLHVILGSSAGEVKIQWCTAARFWLEHGGVVHWSRFGPCWRTQWCHVLQRYQTRHDSAPLFMIDVSGQLKALWNSSKLLIAPTTRYLGGL